MNHRSCLRILALLLLTMAATSFAQSTDPFYPKNFAKDPLGRDLRPEPNATRAPTLRATPGTVPTPGSIATPVPSVGTVAPLAPGLKVKKIGAVISGLEVPHLRQAITELLQVAKKHDLDVGTVYAVGVPLEGATDQSFGAQVLAISMRGGVLELTGEAPEGLPVKRSPTWILKTDGGDVVVEGFLTLDRFIAGDGTLLEPQGVAGELPPIATINPEAPVAATITAEEVARRVRDLQAQLPPPR